jgi:SulP family sulfate permease
MWRYDAEAFYRFVDAAEELGEGARDPVQLFVPDCSSLSEVDFSAARGILQLVDYGSMTRPRTGMVG